MLTFPSCLINVFLQFNLWPKQGSHVFQSVNLFPFSLSIGNQLILPVECPAIWILLIRAFLFPLTCSSIFYMTCKLLFKSRSLNRCIFKFLARTLYKKYWVFNTSIKRNIISFFVMLRLISRFLCCTSIHYKISISFLAPIDDHCIDPVFH